MKVGTTADRILIEYDFGKHPKQVWAALTSPEAIAGWWGDHVSLTPKTGGAFREEWVDEAGREVVTSGVVNRCEAPELLEFSWADDDWPHATHVALILEPLSAEKTRLRLEHRGWSGLPAEKQQRLIEKHAAGWHHHLRALEAYLER
jgi:uncharacterized protein YndB with AHSA1/START domain